MLPAGKYTAIARDFELGRSEGGNQSEYVRVSFEIVEGDESGKRVSWWGYLTEGTVDRTFEALRVCGWDGDDLSTLDGLGRYKVSIVLTEDEYNGKKRTRVRFINKLSPGLGPAKNRLSDDDVKRINAQWGNRIKAASNVEGRAVEKYVAAPRVTGHTQDTENDDLPF